MRHSTSAVYATENAAISGIDMKIDSPVTEHKHPHTPARLTVSSNIIITLNLSFTYHIKVQTAIYLGDERLEDYFL